jgi:hypothetical protein
MDDFDGYIEEALKKEAAVDSKEQTRSSDRTT